MKLAIFIGLAAGIAVLRGCYDALCAVIQLVRWAL